MKERVLFICTHNSTRSQMAEGLMNSLYGDRYEAFSAGTEKTAVNPRAIEAMKRVGIDISHHRAKSIEEFRGELFDYVVTVCSSARSMRELFGLVQGKLSANRRWTKRYKGPNNFLGIVCCEVCKSPMHIHYPGNENKRRYKYYVCSQRLSYGTCAQDYIRADILERSILEELRNLSARRSEIAVFLEGYRRSAVKRRKALEEKKDEIAGKLTEIETEREGLSEWVLKNRPTEKGMRFLNQKYEEFKIGVFIREARKKSGLTQEELARRAETTKSAISRIENHAEDIKL